MDSCFFSSARLVLLLFTTSPTHFPCISRGQLPSTRIVGTNRVANCAVPKYCSVHQSRVQLRSTEKCAPIAANCAVPVVLSKTIYRELRSIYAYPSPLKNRLPWYVIAYVQSRGQLRSTQIVRINHVANCAVPKRATASCL